MQRRVLFKVIIRAKMLKLARINRGTIQKYQNLKLNSIPVLPKGGTITGGYCMQRYTVFGKFFHHHLEICQMIKAH